MKTKYRGPEGPYRSLWAGKDFFIVRTLWHGEVVYSCVPQGSQPYEGVINLNLRDAHKWMRDNGFDMWKGDEDNGDETLQLDRDRPAGRAGLP